MVNPWRALKKKPHVDRRDRFRPQKELLFLGLLRSCCFCCCGSATAPCDLLSISFLDIDADLASSDVDALLIKRRELSCNFHFVNVNWVAFYPICSFLLLGSTVSCSPVAFRSNLMLSFLFFLFFFSFCIRSIVDWDWLIDFRVLPFMILKRKYYYFIEKFN